MYWQIHDLYLDEKGSHGPKEKQGGLGRKWKTCEVWEHLRPQVH
jgi:hypothetical protein